jgi:hypothetical protein
VAELAELISEFGASAKGKLANAAVTGAPEDQLRAPLEMLVLRLGAFVVPARLRRHCPQRASWLHRGQGTRQGL